MQYMQCVHNLFSIFNSQCANNVLCICACVFVFVCICVYYECLCVSTCALVCSDLRGMNSVHPAVCSAG